LKIGLQTWGSDGDIRPFLALAGGLRSRGHEVSLVVTSVDNKDYSAFGKEMDFAVTHVGAFHYDDKTIRRFQDGIEGTENFLKQIQLIMEYFYKPAVPKMFDAAEQLCSNNDAIIGHTLHYPAQASAEKANKPYATVMMNHAGVYSKNARIYGVPNLGKWMNPYWWKLLHFAVDHTFAPEVNRLREKAGLAPVRKIADAVWVSKRLNLIAESSVIGSEQPDWPAYHHICGVFTMPNKAEQWSMPDGLKQFLEAGPLPIFITLGSMFSLDTEPGLITEILVQGALLAGCRAIVQSKWDELPDFPDHPSIYKIQRVPHQHVFPRCSAIVHHGGAGTSHSALLHGCPSIVIEHIADQSFFANELKRLGVAPAMLHRRRLTPAKLAKAIRAVLDNPGMKRKAEELSGLMKKEQGVQTAVGLIEKHLSAE